MIPYAELDPRGRARCKHCEAPLEKGGLRVVLGRGVSFGSQVRTAPINVHPRCVAGEIASTECSTEVEGFADALRANSGHLDPGQVERVLTEIGEL